MARPKVAVIGAGNVGATTAQWIGHEGMADVTLIDIVEGVPQGKALDLQEALPILGADVRFTGSNNLGDMAGSEVVVITAGVPRKPGMSRDDLLSKNAEIVGGIAEATRQHAPDAIIIVVSNPLDVMTWLTWEKTALPRHRVMGMAGVLDSARFSYFVADALGISVKDVRALVLGGHGDMMVPMPRFTTVSGIPVPELLSAEQLAAIAKRTRDGGAEIVNLLRMGSAFYAPGACITAMVAAILRDEKRVMVSCVRLEGEYGLRDVFLGVPVKIGANGIEKIIDLKLKTEEAAALRQAAERVKELWSALKKTPAAAH